MSHADYASQVFGLSFGEIAKPAAAQIPVPPTGECYAVIGASGAGKTLALSALDKPGVVPLRCDELSTPVLELFDSRIPSEQVLRSLARMGLADGRLWGMQAGQLSPGETRRLEFARALCANQTVLIADEFDAHLDATTACALAENLHRIVKREGLALIVSTHRPETLEFLQPKRVFEINAGQATERTNPPDSARNFLDEVEITRGRLRDYLPFAHWHYLGPGRPGPTSDVFVARHQGRAVGIVVFGYPHLLLSARASVLPQFSPKSIADSGAAVMNLELRLLQRVIVEPRLRGVGIAGALIRHGLNHITAPYVECIAQMGAFSDFLLSSGFSHVQQMRPPASARALTEFLNKHSIPASSLLSATARAEQRARLRNKDAKQLDKLLARLANTRIQTGFGSYRSKPAADLEALLNKALARLEARPSYYLWSRESA